MWMVAKSKNVPGGIASSVTTSLRASPSRSGPKFFVDARFWTLAREVDWLTVRLRKDRIYPCVVIENSPTVRKRNSNGRYSRCAFHRLGVERPKAEKVRPF